MKVKWCQNDNLANSGNSVYIERGMKYEVKPASDNTVPMYPEWNLENGSCIQQISGFLQPSKRKQ